MRYFTSDTHFGSDSNAIIEREMRPFSGPADYTTQQVKIWNDIAGPDDTIYCIGNFCNYNKNKLKEALYMSAQKYNQFADQKVLYIFRAKGDYASYEDYEVYFGKENYKSCCI